MAARSLRGIERVQRVLTRRSMDIPIGPARTHHSLCMASGAANQPDARLCARDAGDSESAALILWRARCFLRGNLEGGFEATIVMKPAAARQQRDSSQHDEEHTTPHARSLLDGQPQSSYKQSLMRR